MTTISDVIKAKRKRKVELEERLTKIKAHGETMDDSDYRPQGDDSRSAPWQKSEEEGAAELQRLRDKQKKRK